QCGGHRPCRGLVDGRGGGAADRCMRGLSARRRGVAVTPMETRREVIVQAAVLADELGYELFSVAEGWGLDSTLVLTEIALRTQRPIAANEIGRSGTGGSPSRIGRTPGTPSSRDEAHGPGRRGAGGRMVATLRV